MPGQIGGWPTSAFGFLGTVNTSRFHGPLCYQRSLRLFLSRDLLIPSKQAFADDDAGISIGVAAHLALWAKDQRGPWGVSFCW